MRAGARKKTGRRLTSWWWKGEKQCNGYKHNGQPLQPDGVSLGTALALPVKLVTRWEIFAFAGAENVREFSVRVPPLLRAIWLELLDNDQDMAKGQEKLMWRCIHTITNLSGPVDPLHLEVFTFTLAGVTDSDRRFFRLVHQCRLF